MRRLTIVVVLLLLSLGTAHAACTDAAAVAATRAAADAQCPCGAMSSHKTYLHCVVLGRRGPGGRGQDAAP